MANWLTSSGINAGQAINYGASSIPPGTCGQPRQCGGRVLAIGKGSREWGIYYLSNPSGGDDNDRYYFRYRLS